MWTEDGITVESGAIDRAGTDPQRGRPRGFSRGRVFWLKAYGPVPYSDANKRKME